MVFFSTTKKNELARVPQKMRQKRGTVRRTPIFVRLEHYASLGGKKVKQFSQRNRAARQSNRLNCYKLLPRLGGKKKTPLFQELKTDTRRIEPPWRRIPSCSNEEKPGQGLISSVLLSQSARESK